MSSQVEFVDFHLPASSSTLSFLKLPSADRVRVIELGMKFLSAGNQQLQCWDNEQWTTKLNRQRHKFEKCIADLEQERDAERRKLAMITDRHRDDMRHVESRIKEQMQTIFGSEITDLKTKLERKDDKLRDSNEDNRNIYRQAYQEFEVKRNIRELAWEGKMEDLRSEYERKLKSEKQERESLISRTQNSTIIGQDGENFTLHALNIRFPKADIEDTHKQKGRGDFIFKEGAFSMLIETKNYRNNVTKPEIDKFYRDIDTNHDINCGILISLKSGVCSRDDFQLEVRDGKPILFLHQISSNMHNIKLAVLLFKLILKTDSIDLSCKEIVDKVRNSIPILKRNWNKMRQKVLKFNQEMTECISDQERLISSVFDMMNLKK